MLSLSRRANNVSHDEAPEGKVYLVLENLIANVKTPCILDIKLGTLVL